MRHAWLIIAHNEFAILQHLVSLLDDERSDFYLHFDAKVKELPSITVEKGRLFILNNRVDVRWGTVSQLEAELLLLETAHQSGPYAHYHILSGVHLPLKPFDRLMQFTAMLSLNLAIINLLPLPALDGGHFLILLIEAITGHKLGKAAMQNIQKVGMAMILALTIFATFKDLTR